MVADDLEWVGLAGEPERAAEYLMATDKHRMHLALSKEPPATAGRTATVCSLLKMGYTPLESDWVPGPPTPDRGRPTLKHFWEDLCFDEEYFLDAKRGFGEDVEFAVTEKTVLRVSSPTSGRIALICSVKEP